MVILTFGVIQIRFGEQVALGHGNNARLERRIRAHGNTAEQAPIFVVQLALFELAGAPQALLCAIAVVFVVARVVFSVGLYLAAVTPMRKLGMVATLGSQMTLSVCLLLRLLGVIGA